MSTGVLLPEGVVQPFDLRYAADDLHVMAFFEGHDTYEAVEAMIRRRPGGAFRVRAILTRHDQTQVDHVNDEGAFRAARSLRRETCMREISVTEEAYATGRRAVVRFVSARGEQIELDVVSAGPLDGGRGGVSDPGTHSLHTSLPVMWRGASALAAPASRVAIDGRAWPMPARQHVGGRVVAVEGYLSEPHRMTALRAGSTAYEIIERPARFEPGQRWLQRSADGERAYRITRVGAAGAIEIVGSQGAPVTLNGHIVDGRLCLHQLRVGDAAQEGSDAHLAFGPDGAFSIGIEATCGLVTGRFATSEKSAGTCAIQLEPRDPVWARERAIAIRIESRARTVSVATTIGASAAMPGDETGSTIPASRAPATS